MILEYKKNLAVECFCFQMTAKALGNLHTAQDFVEQLKAYILLYISSKSTCKSTHGTRLCGVAQGLPTYCYIYRPKALVNLHTAQDFVE